VGRGGNRTADTRISGLPFGGWRLSIAARESRDSAVAGGAGRTLGTASGAPNGPTFRRSLSERGAALPGTARQWPRRLVSHLTPLEGLRSQVQAVLRTPTVGPQGLITT
jgi:hypothetical protein